ncbi:transforming growth factor beta activator LRRC33 [Protopterus annectens]|uniref:transforming growth factor beta activator LRRC33 n=1 Tax=Protopterus annectens TaxID=7888 RepID=UPI001CFB2DBE|nr:transforming growth factor beta activator LRRC33 [Protopterus annectens]
MPECCASYAYTNADIKMEMLSIYFWLKFIVLLTCRCGSDSLPHKHCNLIEETAVCSTSGLDTVPPDLPQHIRGLVLNRSIIKSLKSNSLLLYSDLEDLNLSENEIEMVEMGAFHKQKRLQKLRLNDNALHLNYQSAANALQDLSSLRLLDLSGNKLSEDMVMYLLQKPLPSLETLSLSRNIIMRLEHSTFEGLSHLKELNLEKNYIYEIEEGTFDDLKALLQLNLAYNYISCIVQFSLVQLKMLNISFNIIEWFLTAETDERFELEILDLSHNKLLFFPVLPKYNRLRSLLLTDNEISFYGRFAVNSSSQPSKVTFIQIINNVTNITTVDLWDEADLGNMSSLISLDMSHNQIRYLPENFLSRMTSLTHLNLGQNCLEEFLIADTEPPFTLIELDLSQNNLSEIEVNVTTNSILPHLSALNFSKNMLGNIPADIFSLMQNITTIDLSHNNIKVCPVQMLDSWSHQSKPVIRNCVVFQNIHSLRNLYLSNCRLEPLPRGAFRGTSLTYLDLSDNHGAIANMSPLQEISLTLQCLSLRNTWLSNHMSKIDFSEFQQLKELDLSKNSLIAIPNGLHKLRKLDLRTNLLVSLQQDVIQKLRQSLHHLYLSDNPYDCCLFSWWDELSKINVPDKDLMSCNYSTQFFSVTRLPPSVVYDCKWRGDNLVFMYLILALPTCLTAVVGFTVFFLTFKQHLFKIVKRKCMVSASY